MLKNLLNQSSKLIAQQADKTFVDYFIKGKRLGQSPRPQMSQEKAIAFIERLEGISEGYTAERWAEETLFRSPTPPQARRQKRLSAKQTRLWFGASVEVEDLNWTSTFDCLEEAIARGYNTPENETVHARLFTQPAKTPRPVAILIHGYRGGVLSLEERIWPIQMFSQAGFDVALIVLPHHGNRLPSLQARPLYPSRDVRLTIEGIRQGVEDVRALMRILRMRGHQHIGVCGMSLGGYITSLLTTVEPELAFSVPMIPLASFAQWAKEANTLVGQDDATRMRHQQAIEALCAVIDPLGRACKIANDHILVVGGEVDSVTPLSHARSLAKHFQCPLEVFTGGHLLQVGRKAAFARALDVMRYACAS